MLSEEREWLLPAAKTLRRNIISRGMCRDSIRFCVCLLTFLCLASICSNFIIINFTFICMTEDKSDVIQLDNGTLRQRYDYTPLEKNSILMWVAIGTIVGTFPTNAIFTRIGARIPFILSGLTSAAATAFFPWAAENSFPTMLFLRFLQGFAYSADFAAIGAVVVKWAPLKETSFFIGFLTVFNVLSSLLTNSISASLCESSLGWRWSFYGHSIVGLVLFTSWFLLFTDDPVDHPLLSTRELAIIHKGKSKEHIAKHNKVPYWDIMTNRVILVLWLNSFVELTSMLLLITYAPTYFSRVLGFDVMTTGTLTSLISLAILPFRFSFCVTSDRIRYFSEKTKMVVYNTIAFTVSGVLFMLIAFAPTPWVSVLLFGLVTIAGSANCGGFYKCASFVARQHAHFVISAIQFTKCLALFAAPAIVSFFVKSDSDRDGWNFVFLTNGAALILVNIGFWFVVTDEPAAFTNTTESVDQKKKAVE